MKRLVAWLYAWLRDAVDNLEQGYIDGKDDE